MRSHNRRNTVCPAGLGYDVDANAGSGALLSLLNRSWCWRWRLSLWCSCGELCSLSSFLLLYRLTFHQNCTQARDTIGSFRLAVWSRRSHSSASNLIYQRNHETLGKRWRCFVVNVAMSRCAFLYAMRLLTRDGTLKNEEEEVRRHQTENLTRRMKGIVTHEPDNRQRPQSRFLYPPPDFHARCEHEEESGRCIPRSAPHDL